MLDKLRIGPKLLLAPGLVLALLLLLSGAAWYGMQRQHALLENLVQVRAARLETAAAVAGEATHAHANVYQLLARINGSFAQARVDALRTDINRRHGALAIALAELARVSDPAERRIVEASTAALSAYRASVNDTVDMALVDHSLATNAMQKAERQFGQLSSHLAQLAALEKHLSVAAYQGATSAFADLGATMAALVALSIALSALVTVLVRRSMLAAIHAIGDVVDDLAHGRLMPGAASAGRDEIADTSRALARTINRLGDTLLCVRDAVHSIDSASQDIASGNLDLSARTELQASSLEETASAMQALTGAVAANAADARCASELAAATAQLAAAGGDAVQRAVTTMDQIRGGSRKIAEIIGVMDSIAFQTNLLALNAGVEAARAGSQGRGFAVVAAEVRALAQRSAAAAHQVKTLIAASVAGIEAGSASVNAAGASMVDIVASAHQVGALVARISAASAEQAAGIAEVNLAVGHMDGMTQQNAALVEQAAAAAASLHAQTLTLSHAVSVFQIKVCEDGPDDLYRYRGDNEDNEDNEGNDDYPSLTERRAGGSRMRAAKVLPIGKRRAHGKPRGWREA